MGFKYNMEGQRDFIIHGLRLTGYKKCPSYTNFRKIGRMAKKICSWYDWLMDIELLNSERLVDWGGRLKFPSGAVDALQAVSRLVRSDEVLCSIFTEFHGRTALRGEWHREWSDLPFDARVQARLGEAGINQPSLFYLLAYMAALSY